MKRGEDSSEGICLIHGEPTDFEAGDIHGDDREGLALALEVVRASLPRRGDKGRDDRLFLEAMRAGRAICANGRSGTRCARSHPLQPRPASSGRSRCV